MTHKRLVKLAKAWLRTKGCKLILSERVSSLGESPDVIGWLDGRASVLIECKASLADFRRDYDKWFRHNGLGMGQKRYFMAPAGMIPKNEIPDGWGLLEVVGTKIRTVIDNELLFYDDHRAAAEIPLLVACLRQAQLKLSMQKGRRRVACNRD
jgi:hypothetical protein